MWNYLLGNLNPQFINAKGVEGGSEPRNILNGLAWLIFGAATTHFLLDHYLNVLLKQLHVSECTRNRLCTTAWNCIYYYCMYAYCCTAITQYHFNFPEEQRFDNAHISHVIPTNLIGGYALLAALFLSTVAWNLLRFNLTGLASLLLTIILILSGFLNFHELPIWMARLLSGTQLMFECSRCLWIVMGKCEKKLRIYTRTFVFFVAIVALLLYFTINFHLIVLVTKSALKRPSSTFNALIITLYAWYFVEIYNSPLYRLAAHQLIQYRGGGNAEQKHCRTDLIECALFLPRDDLAYNMKIFKDEMKQREDKLKALRKPKTGTNMILQTLKYYRGSIQSPQALRELIVSVSMINKKIKNRRNTSVPTKEDDRNEQKKKVETMEKREDIDTFINDLLMKKLNEELIKSDNSRKTTD